jgi:hypothetical protein
MGRERVVDAALFSAHSNCHWSCNLQKSSFNFPVSEETRPNLLALGRTVGWHNTRQAQTEIGLGIILMSLMFISGCATGEKSTASLEPPRDGKILVSVGGNVTANGGLWLPEDASLASLEDLVGVRPEWESRRLRITRTGTKTLELRLDKMTRAEKEKVRLHHGDAVFFVRDRCFGFLPNNNGANADSESERGQFFDNSRDSHHESGVAQFLAGWP